MTTLDEIYQAFVALPRAQQSILLDRLLAEETDESVVSPAWRAEIKRRVELAKTGATGKTSWQEISAEFSRE